jgi:hypothetical protein
MRKWRAENRDKNKKNDLRCRVYRLARQRFGDADCIAKQSFIREEIAKRLGRRMIFLNEQAPPESPVPSLMPRRASSTSESSLSSEDSYSDDFRSAYEPQNAFIPATRPQKPSMVALPSISQCLMQPNDKFAMSLPLPKPSFSACPTPLLSPTSISNGSATTNGVNTSTKWNFNGSPASPTQSSYPAPPFGSLIPKLAGTLPKRRLITGKTDEKFNILEDFVSTVLDYAGVRDKSL